MAGDFNDKNEDWDSRLNTRRGKHLGDYADGNYCLIFGPDNPPSNSFATPDVLNIVITKKLIFSV
jgi:hypothetical protein